MTSLSVNFGIIWLSNNGIINIALENLFRAENITPLMMQLNKRGDFDNSTSLIFEPRVRFLLPPISFKKIPI